METAQADGPATGAGLGLRYFEPEFETMPRDQLDRVQWTLFEEQLARALESDFYQRKWGGTVRVADIRSRADLRSIPVTRKDEICDDLLAHPPYGSRLIVDSGRITNIVETSGTSGKGKEVHVRTAADLDSIVRAEAIGFTWAGMGAGTVVGFTIPVTMSAAGLLWFLTLDRLGTNCLRVGNYDTEEKLRYMAHYGVETIIAMPTYLQRLEAAALQMGMWPERDLPRLRTILVAGEAKSTAWALERQRAWGATVHEQWGCTQGAVTFACERGMAPDGRPGVLHGIPHLILTEVVDPETGGHVEDGMVGELVITPLGIEGAPLIRFATGDQARFRAASSCPCGRPFDGIEASSVLRYDDMIKVKGVNLWPSTISTLVDGSAAVAEHRITAALDADSRETLTVEVEFRPEADATARAAALDSLRRELRVATALKVDVAEWRGAHSLASEVLGEGVMKARRWRDLRDQGRGG